MMKWKNIIEGRFISNNKINKECIIDRISMRVIPTIQNKSDKRRLRREIYILIIYCKKQKLLCVYTKINKYRDIEIL